MKLLFKKLLAAPVYLGVGFAGTIAFAMLLAPLNLPFLLKFDEDMMYLIYLLLGVVFLSVVATIVRTQHLRSADLFEDDPEKSLFLRVVTSWEYITDQIAFAVWAIAFIVYGGVKSGAPWQTLLTVTVCCSVIGGLLFAAIDCVIWIISYKKIRR